MMATKITAPSGPLQCTPALPASKSISNRALILRAMSGSELPIHNLSEADDTRTLQQLLNSQSHDLYSGYGGTTLRFLLTYLAAKGGRFTFTASHSLASRPIRPLLAALEKLGCRFESPSEENLFPLTMRSEGLKSSGPLELPGDVSSQFISALMMAGPFVENGLQLHLTGEVLSRPYIEMTAGLMRLFGVDPKFVNGTIFINEGKYTPAEVHVEPDWSAATYWYEMAALRPGSEIKLRGLALNSLQGDRSVADAMKYFGIATVETEGYLMLKSSGLQAYQEKLIFDLTDCPDTAPALICTAAGMGLTADFPGLKNFRLKECDRAAAFQRELYNFGVNTDFCGGSKFKVYGGSPVRSSTRIIKTYHDHRVAMAIAPLALVAGPVLIDDISVVSKSYPGFWQEIEKAGFKAETE